MKTARFARHASKSNHHGSRPRRLQLEPLEDRRLLSVGLANADPAGEIHGQKWHDLDGDGVRDVGDIGLDGWTIKLVDRADNSVVATTLTADVDLDENGTIDPETEAGLYSFTGLAQGSYEIREVVPAGWVQSFPLIATGQFSFVQVLRDGQDDVDGLDGTTAVTISPDGNHVYAASYPDDALAVFNRDGATGQLNFVQSLRDGQGAVDGLNGARSVTVSPDGNHVYAAGSNDDAVAVFSRDGVTGRLSFVQSLRDGQDGVDGLDGVRSVTVSPDGNHVYTAGAIDVAVAVFSRDLGAGPYQVVLGPDEILTDQDFGNYQPVSISGQKFEDLDVDGVHDAGELGLDDWTIELVDPATGTVIDTQVTVSVDLDENGTIDPETEAGLYSFDGLTPGSYEVREVVGEGYLQTCPNPPTYSLTLLSGDVIADRDFGNAEDGSISGQMFDDFNGNGLHDAGEPGLDGWTIELVDPATGTVIDTRMTAGIDLDGDRRIDPETETGLYSFDGLLPGNYEVREVLQPDWVQTLPDPSTYSIALAYGQDLVGQDFGNRGIGEIHGQKWHDVNGNGVRDADEPGLDGWTIELVNRSDGSVVATTVTAGVDLNEDGNIDPETEAGLYSFADLSRGSYEVREVVQAGWVRTFPSGELSFVQMLRDRVGGVDGLDGAYSVTVSPDGKHVYAASGRDDAVAVFSRDGATGQLNFVQMLRNGLGGVDGLDGAYSVTVSPDGNHVYTASYDDDAVAVFSRDGATGQLIFLQAIHGGLDGASSVTVSPDGKHVYVTSSRSNAVMVFGRDGATGQMSFVQRLRDGQGGVDGLDAARSVTVSPDGKHVYVASDHDDAVAVFSRDGATGQLKFVQMARNGQGGVDGLDSAWSVTVSPDGKHVYAVSLGDDAVTVFSRDGATGRLTFVQMLRDGQGGIDGLNGAQSVTVSPDGKHVYTASWGDDAVAVFSRDRATGRLNFLQALYDGLNGAASVTVSPDGKHVYTASYFSDAVTVFRRDLAAGVYQLSLGLGEILTGRDFGNYRIPAVVGRHVFYNRSSFDGNDPTAGPRDDNAIASDKQALLPDQTATFANYTTYDKGLNGVMVDLLTFTDSDLLDPAEDFEFRVGNGLDSDSWSTAPEPSGWTVRKGEGVDGSDRITFVWADRAIEKQWLRVTVGANDRTGLPVPDVFYFGNAPGEAGDSVVNAIVNATDEIVARNFQHGAVGPAAIEDPYDYNRDGLVNATDQIIARENQTNPLSMLRLITAPVADAAFEQIVYLDWRYEFDRMNTKSRSTKKDGSIEATVDMLLATDWA
ncbi:MAG: beta-propeller fold lactonase family protein [Thermoguttaceae bacterium]